jgi:hypothetical protein
LVKQSTMMLGKEGVLGKGLNRMVPWEGVLVYFPGVSHGKSAGAALVF